MTSSFDLLIAEEDPLHAHRRTTLARLLTLRNAPPPALAALDATLEMSLRMLDEAARKRSWLLALVGEEGAMAAGGSGTTAWAADVEAEAAAAATTAEASLRAEGAEAAAATRDGAPPASGGVDEELNREAEQIPMDVEAGAAGDGADRTAGRRSVDSFAHALLNSQIHVTPPTPPTSARVLTPTRPKSPPHLHALKPPHTRLFPGRLPHPHAPHPRTRSRRRRTATP